MPSAPFPKLHIECSRGHLSEDICNACRVKCLLCGPAWKGPRFSRWVSTKVLFKMMTFALLCFALFYFAVSCVCNLFCVYSAVFLQHKLSQIRGTQNTCLVLQHCSGVWRNCKRLLYINRMSLDVCQCPVFK